IAPVTCHGARVDTARRRARRPACRRSGNGQCSRQGAAMPLIKPRTRGKQFVRLVTRLEQETNETLYAYAHFLSEPAEHLLNQLIDTVLAKDKEYAAWRAEHPQSFAPRRPARIRKRAAARNGTRTATHVENGVSSAAVT